MNVTDTAIPGRQAAEGANNRPGVCTHPTATNANTTSSARHTALHYHKGTGGAGRCALRSCTQEFEPTARMPRVKLAVFARLTAAWFHAPARQPPSAVLWRWGALVVPSLQHH